MDNLIIPSDYKPQLSLYDTQKAIGLIKRLFADFLAGALYLSRVSAPLFVEASTGLNDDLNGVERPVSFDVPATGGEAQVVQSLAKWKRKALHDYGFTEGAGLYTDMNAIRRDEESLDNLHSVYVDQWDWEKIIPAGHRDIQYLRDTVTAIVGAVCDTQEALYSMFPKLSALPALQRSVTFVKAQELEDRWPDKTPKEREGLITREHRTVFIMGIGGPLRSGQKHDGRAPDYDDWDMNGDILCWDDTLDCAVELSSMGIRVSPESLDRQLTAAGCDERRKLPFHKMLLEGKLPLTIGGGIGQSRLCMLLLGSAHIGEVQSSVWSVETRRRCAGAGFPLL